MAPADTFRIDLRISIDGEELDTSSDATLVSSFQWREEIGRVPVGEIEFAFTGDDASSSPTLDKWIGKDIKVAVETPDDAGGETKQHYNGVVTAMRGVASQEEVSYIVEFRPKLWAATQRACCKVWENSDENDMSPPSTTLKSIVERILSESGLSGDITCAYNGKAKTRYCVQYRETQYNFLMRLIEADGAYIVYDHADAEMKGKIVDTNTALSKTLELIDHAVASWNVHFTPRPGKAKVFGYDYRASAVEITAEHTRQDDADLGALGFQTEPIGEFPGDLDNQDNAAHAAQLIGEANICDAAVLEADAFEPAIFPGVILELSGAFGQGPKDKLEKVFVVAAEHSYDGAEGFRVSFRATASDRPHRTPRTTPRPRIHGVQTAIVTKSEADTEELGRIRVKFPWDPDGESPALRVAQPWASAEVGVFTLPNIDDEVLVAFESGDPERPIVVGSLWNSRHKPPVALPSDWTQTRIKTRRGHQLTFEDKDGGEYVELITGQKQNLIKLDDSEEKILVHATKDYTTTVDNDYEVKVGNNYMLEATTKIELKVGQSSITIDSSGITIKSSTGDIGVEGINVEAKAQAQAELSGNATATLKSSGMTEVKGSLVKIN